MAGGEALSLRGVSRRFGGLLAVRDVTMSVAHGERRVLVGPNGAGKTTLFNLIAGDLPVSSGAVVIDGKDVTTAHPYDRARMGVARSYQRSTLFGGLSVADNVRLAILGAKGPRFSIRRRDAAGLDARIQELGEMVGLRPVLGTDTRYLSHGQQRQLELGVALAASPHLLLLDEPAAGLSPAERHLLSQLLHDLPRELTIVLIEHDMDVALPFADQVTVMHDGLVVEQGTPNEIANSQIVHEIYLGSGHV